MILQIHLSLKHGDSKVWMYGSCTIQRGNEQASLEGCRGSRKSSFPGKCQFFLQKVPLDNITRNMICAMPHPSKRVCVTQIPSIILLALIILRSILQMKRDNSIKLRSY